MTTKTASASEQSAPTWALWLLIIAAVILFIWVWNTANSAKSTAESNQALLIRPEFQLAYIVGGPSRFADEFEEAVEDADLTDFAADELVWGTVEVRNSGASEAEDATLTASLNPELQPTIIASLPSFGSSLDISKEDGTYEIDLRDIGDGERALVFLGFDPANLPESFSNDWPGNYLQTMGQLTVESGDFEETVFGRWL